jgi:protease-4
MARRGIRIIFTLLSLAVVVSIAGVLVLYLVLGVGEPSVPSGATLTLDVGGDLAEVAPTDVLSYVQGARRPTIQDIVDNLRKARVDDRIKGVLLKPTGFSTPYWGKVQEIRDAVVSFRASGKPIYAYLEYGADAEYYLASAADRVFLMPSSPLALTGIASYEVFLRGTLDKVGAYADLHHVGAYKTAVNTFTEQGFTKTHREMAESINRDSFEHLVGGIAEGRRKTEAEVRSLIDHGPFLPEQAVQAGLVDDVAYEDEVRRELDGEDPGRRREIDSERYARVGAASVGLNRGPRIAVIHASGAIASGESGFDPLNGAVVGSETLIEAIRSVRRDASVRAIVLRIDSPGGSATASDAIWRELMLARNERADRPIVASMSDLAASGGYYIAMPAHAIVAQPSTLTGSIGIFGGKFVTGGVYQKLGANIESTSIGRYAEMNSPARPYNPDEAGKVREQLQAFYDQFVEKVAAARKRTPEEIDRVAQGRVWTGRQAKEHGLVDALGGLHEAIAIAKEKAGIGADADVEIVPYPAPKSLYELMSDQLAGSAGAAWRAAGLTEAERETLRTLRGPAARLSLFRRGEPLAMMPLNFLR